MFATYKAMRRYGAIETVSGSPEEISIHVARMDFTKYIDVSGRLVRVNHVRDRVVERTEPAVAESLSEPITGDNRTILNMLDDECLSKMAAYLDITSLCTIRQTCRRFDQIGTYLLGRTKINGSIRKAIEMLPDPALQLWKFEDILRHFGVYIRVWKVYAHTTLSKIKVALVRKYCPDVEVTCNRPHCSDHPM